MNKMNKLDFIIQKTHLKNSFGAFDQGLNPSSTPSFLIVQGHCRIYFSKHPVPLHFRKLCQEIQFSKANGAEMMWLSVVLLQMAWTVHHTSKVDAVFESQQMANLMNKNLTTPRLDILQPAWPIPPRIDYLLFVPEFWAKAQRWVIPVKAKDCYPPVSLSETCDEEVWAILIKIQHCNCHKTETVQMGWNTFHI